MIAHTDQPCTRARMVGGGGGCRRVNMCTYCLANVAKRLDTKWEATFVQFGICITLVWFRTWYRSFFFFLFLTTLSFKLYHAKISNFWRLGRYCTECMFVNWTQDREVNINVSTSKKHYNTSLSTVQYTNNSTKSKSSHIPRPLQIPTAIL